MQNTDIQDISEYSDLSEIWEKKEYRVYPTAILEYLRQDHRINDAEHLCWLYLLDMAYFENEWVIKRSREQIAQDLRKQPRTISRILRKLEECGYIMSRRQCGDISEYAVRFPKEAVDKIMIEMPNRKKAAKINTGSNTTKSIKENFHEVLPKVARGVARFGTNTINNTMLTNNNCAGNIVNKKNEIAKPVVVGDLKIHSEKNKKQLEENQNHIEMITSQLIAEKDRIKRYDLTKQRNALESENERIIMNENQKFQRQQQKSERAAEQKQYINDPSYMSNKPGARSVSDFQLKRIQHSLEKIGQLSHQLVNEVVYEVRFGSLCVARDSQRETAIDYAINIAMKLVREGRWRTPVGILEKISVTEAHAVGGAGIREQ